jgi:hypothetical protein
MPLIKLNNRSIKDVTSLPFGVGNLIHIQSQTASSSASISFTTGIDSTYKEYQFYFINIHPATNGASFRVNFSTDSGSNYNVTKTTTSFEAYHNEADNDVELRYDTAYDQAQSTAFLNIADEVQNSNDAHASGTFTLFNPSSTTYVKHFISNFEALRNPDYSWNYFKAGYANTTSAINAIRFQFSSGNIDDGTIAMFGVL